MWVVYKMVCGMFVDPEELNDAKKPTAVSTADVSPPAVVAPREPVQLGDVTEQELRAYNGSDPSKPLLMAIKGQIYDVSASR